LFRKFFSIEVVIAIHSQKNYGFNSAAKAEDEIKASKRSIFLIREFLCKLSFRENLIYRLDED
jgi:hypothetical protein